MTENSLTKNDKISEFSSNFRKPKNEDVRTREYLTEDEIEKLLLAAKKMSRYGHRNYCLVLTMFRHGLRVGEASYLKWSDVDLKAGRVHVKRSKNGYASVHPIYGVELRALKQLDKSRKSGYVFESERGSNISDSGIRQMFAKIGKDSGFDFVVHPHMMRHSCGYYMINKGIDVRVVQDWLGHKDIKCTAIYTKLSSNRFDGIFDD